MRYSSRAMSALLGSCCAAACEGLRAEIAIMAAARNSRIITRLLRVSGRGGHRRTRCRPRSMQAGPLHLVEQSAVADLQRPGCVHAVPAGLVENLREDTSLRGEG